MPKTMTLLEKENILHYGNRNDHSKVMVAKKIMLVII